MDIALINSPIRLQGKPRNIPTGLGIIANVLRSDGHNVRWIDLNSNRDERDNFDLIGEIIRPAGVVGISGMITTYEFQKNLIRFIKENFPEKFVVSGGSLPSSVPDLMFEKTLVDAVCIGEGEYTMSELLYRMEQKQDITQIEGLWLRDNDRVIRNPQRALIKKLDSLPFPAYDLIDMETYLSHYKWSPEEGRSANIITSRGCPFNCSFCYHIFGCGKIRFRSSENIHEEIKFLKENYGIKYVAILDDNATVNKKRLSSICKVMTKEKIKWGCHGRVDTASRELFKTMKESGCTFLGFGIESGSNKILKNISKGTTKTEAAEAIQYQREQQFGGNSYIFGSPGENLVTIIETAIFCGQNHKLLSTNMFIMTAYPGTPIFQEALKQGMIDDLETYIMQLDDANKLLLNFTRFPDFLFYPAYYLQILLSFLFYLIFHPVDFFRTIFRKIKQKYL